MTHKDQAGNHYRQTNEGWQVMRPGVGWTVFNNDAPITLDDGTVIPAKEREPEGYSEAEKSFILGHARDVHMQMVASRSELTTPQGCADDSVMFALELAESLKRQGVL